MADATAGDPISGLKWTRKSLRKLSRQLGRKKFKAGRTAVARLLRERQDSLHVNRKRLGGAHTPERDRQFRYIARQRTRFIRAGWPVVSVDAKKKELVGQFKNAGQTWRRQPLDVLEKDFPSKALGKAIPYGIYDIVCNVGYVVIGASHETPTFAVAAIRTWWLVVGQFIYAGQHHLLIEADCGGANGHRCWVWKVGLQALANEFDLTITVAHFPPGASKWNLIEHRMFGLISENWAGQPLDSYETILKFIRTTKSESGFKCQARLDKTQYKAGVKVTAEEKARINLKRHRVFPQWNYTIRPSKSPRK